MASVNHFVGIGRLTRDPELRGSDDSPVCAFAIAINRFGKKREGEQEKTDFIDIVTFGKTAAPLPRLLAKGRLVMVEGRVQQSTWEKDGQRRSKLEIAAYNVQVIDKPKAEAEGPYDRPDANEKEDADGDDDWG